MKTLIFQSCQGTSRAEWLSRCLNSVQMWSKSKGYDYHLSGDEIFHPVPQWFLSKTPSRMAPATDLGRLLMARHFLSDGYQRVVWLDADVFVFDSENFNLTVDDGYAFGREVWVQPNDKGGVKAYRNVHNALSIYVSGNSFLEFYIDSCLKIMSGVEIDHFPAQLLGPKFLTALHSLVGFHLVDDVGMTSPLVLRDIAAGGGAAVDLMRRKLTGPMNAANLCSSLIGTTSDGVNLSEDLVKQCLTLLSASKGSVLSPL